MKLKEIDYEKLDLPANVSEYEILTFGTVEIHGIECYEMGHFQIWKIGNMIWELLQSLKMAVKFTKL
ncbi:MAG: hypothetical protein Q4D02_00420 [Clostridia bacterium]|nr:hypothetical protein [Clostridia bacterium]